MWHGVGVRNPRPKYRSRLSDHRCGATFCFFARLEGPYTLFAKVWNGKEAFVSERIDATVRFHPEDVLLPFMNLENLPPGRLISVPRISTTRTRSIVDPPGRVICIDWKSSLSSRFLESGYQSVSTTEREILESSQR